MTPSRFVLSADSLSAIPDDRKVSARLSSWVSWLCEMDIFEIILCLKDILMTRVGHP